MNATLPTVPTSTEVNPLPVDTIRDQVLKRLEGLNRDMVAVAVDGKLLPEGGAQAKLAVMVRTDDGKWSFAGWLTHSTKPVRDTEFGFELRRGFGGRR